MVQLEVVACPREARDVLFALRNVQHRMLNAALRAWWESDGKDRSSATEAVRTVLENERRYWAEQLPKIDTGIEKLRAKKPRDEGKIPEWEKSMDAEHHRRRRAEMCSRLAPPSAIYDSCVYYTSSKWREYRKHAFRGDKSMATFRHGQPIRVRDGAWELTKADRSGSYDLSIPVQSDGRKVERITMRVVPDGGSMHGWAKKLVEGSARPCDVRIVYVERKEKWFAKVTIAVPRTTPKATGATAALRRGMHSAFVLVAESGDVLTIDGGDVLHAKRKFEARRREIGRHLKSGDIGGGARGRGIKRRFAALARIDDSEKRFVDAKTKQWAAAVARWCMDRGIAKVLVAGGSVSEFHDKVSGEDVAPFIHRWPLAEMNGRVVETLRNGGILAEVRETGLDVRACPAPGCGHRNAKRPAARVFECDACGHKRPADQIVAWNMLRGEVGDGPMVAREAQRHKLIQEVESARG